MDENSIFSLCTLLCLFLELRVCVVSNLVWSSQGYRTQEINEDFFSSQAHQASGARPSTVECPRRCMKCRQRFRRMMYLCDGDPPRTSQPELWTNQVEAALRFDCGRMTFLWKKLAYFRPFSIISNLMAHEFCHTFVLKSISMIWSLLSMSNCPATKVMNQLMIASRWNSL